MTGTHAAPGAEQAAAAAGEYACARAWAALTAAHSRISGQLSSALARACDLSINDFEILLRLDHAPAPGLRLSELNAAIPLTQPSLSRAVRPPRATRLAVAGLVQHLAEVERYWFGYHLAAAPWEAGQEYGMAVPADRAAADVLAGYWAAIEDSDRAIRAAGDPEARFVVPVDGKQHTLRWVMAHMTSETARHAGHADILREQLDGTTGR
jgi:hypothetical protein